MYRITKIMIIILSIVLLISVGCPIQATGFIQETLPPDEEKAMIESNRFTKLETEPAKTMISCFDVNQDGMIAVITDNTGTKAVVVYDSNNEFVTGYEIDYSGSFGVEWFYDELCIYSVRSGLIYSLNDDGSVDSINKIANEYYNDIYWQEHIKSPVRMVGRTKYELRKPIEPLSIFSSSYSQIVKINRTGEEEILYDVSGDHFIFTLILFIGALLLVSVVVFLMIRSFRQALTRQQGKEA